MTDTTLLHPGDPFPELTVALPGGRSLHLPGALAGHFGVVLLYRGSWCPYCNAQLSAFQRSHDGLAALGVSVVAVSVDEEATTQNLISKHGLQFPVGHSADAGAVAAITGAFVNPDPRYPGTAPRRRRPRRPRRRRRAASPSPRRSRHRADRSAGSGPAPPGRS